jgi:hypothetical protein
MFGDETMAIPPHQPFRRQDSSRMSYASPFVLGKSHDYWLKKDDVMRPVLASSHVVVRRFDHLW